MLSAPGEGLFLRLAALMMFLARRRWLALESKLLMMGDMQRLSFVVGTGEVTEDLYTGFVAGKDKLVWESAGDRHRDSQGGETGDVVVEVWVGLDVEREPTEEEFWLANGD